MMVVRVEMWPGGDHTRARCLAVATFANRVEHAGERSYDVVLLKMPEHGGPDVGVGLVSDASADAVRTPNHRQVWKKMAVRGHFPASLGALDLIGGALKMLLGDRLQSYRQVLNRSVTPPAGAP